MSKNSLRWGYFPKMYGLTDFYFLYNLAFIFQYEIYTIIPLKKGYLVNKWEANDILKKYTQSQIYNAFLQIGNNIRILAKDNFKDLKIISKHPLFNTLKEAKNAVYKEINFLENLNCRCILGNIEGSTHEN